MAARKSIDTSINQAIKLDLAASYFTIFDNRKQLRVGLQYEKKITQQSILNWNMDIRNYDHYSFIKYYDFFNQQQGLYSIEQKVLITGFHLTPAYYTLIYQPHWLKPLKWFAGGGVDLSFYQKKINDFNSQTNEQSFQKIYQAKIGMGPSLSARYLITKHFFVELSSHFFMRIWKGISEKNVAIIQSHNAHWTDIHNQFWWVTQLKIAYAW
ncbi:MAG: hypothetical protein IPF62_05675 [Bacteroidetes bacterium]|nr:hypothetical protein [Bacteroidota bacterium]